MTYSLDVRANVETISCPVIPPPRTRHCGITCTLSLQNVNEEHNFVFQLVFMCNHVTIWWLEVHVSVARCVALVLLRCIMEVLIAIMLRAT